VDGPGWTWAWTSVAGSAGLSAAVLGGLALRGRGRSPAPA
jgi:hypothetical protein